MTDALLNPWMAGAFIGSVLVTTLAIRWLLKAVVTFRAMAWVPIMSRRLSSWVTAHHYTTDTFFTADGAPPDILNRRIRALDLAAHERPRTSRAGG